MRVGEPGLPSLIRVALLLGLTLALVLGLLRARSIFPPEPAPDTAELTARLLHVVFSHQGEASEALPVGEARSVVQGDAVDVSEQGEALLRFEDFLVVRIFRDSRLSIENVLDPDTAPIYRYRLEAGTTFNTLTPQRAAESRLRVSTRWAVIENLGTEFLVHYDLLRETTWVVVTDGEVRVTADGQDVLVRAGWQTWVEPGQPPEPPRPATRTNVGNRFPLVDALTNRALRDPDVLAAAPATPVPTPSPMPTSTHTPTPTSTATLTATPTPSITATRTATPTVQPSPTMTPFATPTQTPTPTRTPTLTPTTTPTMTPTATPTPTPTPCPPLSTPSMTTQNNQDQTITVAWRSSGGCSPFKGVLTARYVDQTSPYNRYEVRDRVGEIRDEPPPHCQGEFQIEYLLTLSDSTGQTVRAAAKGSIFWLC